MPYVGSQNSMKSCISLYNLTFKLYITTLNYLLDQIIQKPFLEEIGAK